MTDRELLELAAKAAGVVNYTFHDGVFQPKCLFVETGSRRGDQGYYWSPLTDDGDNRRLQAALEIDVLYRRVGGERVEAVAPSQQVKAEYCNPSTREAATRMAVLRAAAAIGKAMP